MIKSMAEIKVHPDGTITGQVLKYPGAKGIGLIDNGVYTIGYDGWEDKVAIEFKGKDNADQL